MMTTREIYFKNVVEADGLPIGMVGYVYKDTNGTIQLGSTITLELRTDEEVVKKSINQMKALEKTDGFMFWVSSTEGVEFFKENGKQISKAFSQMILNQR